MTLKVGKCCFLILLSSLLYFLNLVHIDINELNCFEMEHVLP